MDRTGNLMEKVPGVGLAAAPLAHDAAKAVQSKTAHWGAAVAAGLAVGGGALGPAADGGLGTSGASRVAAAAGRGLMTGYYGRQGYLAVRCAPHSPETKTCTRLEFQALRPRWRMSLRQAALSYDRHRKTQRRRPASLARRRPRQASAMTLLRAAIDG